MTTKTYKFEQNWEDTKKNDIKVIGHGENLAKGCPQCKGTRVEPTGKLFQKNRTYICIQCKSNISSPTTWAECSNEEVVRMVGGIIGRDLIINDCKICHIPKKEGFDIYSLIKQGKSCPYFRGVVKFEEREQFKK